MTPRFSDKAAIGRRFRRAASLKLLLTIGWLVGLAAFTLACGDSPEITETSVAEVSEAPATGDHEQHLRDLEVQLESLERQSDAMRREVLSRLDQIDITREALSVQLMSLREETGEPAEEVAVVAPPATSPETGTAATPPVASEEKADSTEREHNPFLRFLLLIFILGAIFFLARIFFDRWGDPEDGERPSTVEATTDLGKIRFPPGTEARPEEDQDPELGDPENGDEGRPGD